MLTLYVPSWSMRCPSAFFSDGDLAIIAATSDAVIAGAAGAPAGACPSCAQIANVSNVTKLVAAIISINMQPPLVPYVLRRYDNSRIYYYFLIAMVFVSVVDKKGRSTVLFLYVSIM